jgi:DNA polymerase III alpha subunit
LLYGVPTIDQLVSTARKKGFIHLGITDINGLYGVVEFFKKCKDEGIHPIIGADLRHKNHRLVCLASDRIAYIALSQLITRLHLSPDFSCYIKN